MLPPPSLPPESLLLLTLEEYRCDARKALRKVCAHLEIDEKFEFSGCDVVRHGGCVYQRRRVFSGSSRFSGRIYRVLGRCASWILPFELYNSIKRTIVSSEYGRFRFNRAVKRRILEQLRPDLERLETFYGIGIESEWNLGDLSSQ